MKQLIDSALEFIEVPIHQASPPFCAVVAEGLSSPQKWLPCRFFYDTVGSHLFERICQLPEYYPTRTEHAILERYAPEIVAAAGQRLSLVEFGSGSSVKTRLLLDACLARQRRLHYTSIDISAEFLRKSALALLREYDRLTITALASEYNDGIAALPDEATPRLFLFLGSNIGNFRSEEAVEFLKRIRQRMQSQDRLLIGVDLMKERSILEAAYNDAQGVTALFNKNLLIRINRELGGEFDVSAFDHLAPFVAQESRIEMQLVSRRRQSVPIAALEQEFRFETGEYIHTEDSHKYSIQSFTAFCKTADLNVQQCWQDEHAWFALFLLRPFPARSDAAQGALSSECA